MTRLPDWPARLNALFAAAHRQAFEWGTRDCCLWAADAVRACTGADPAQAVRGEYCTPADAYRLLRAMGGLRGAGALAGPQISPLQARAGDVGLVRVDRPMLAVCAGEVWMVAATRGLHALPLTAATMAWGVGHA